MTLMSPVPEKPSKKLSRISARLVFLLSVITNAKDGPHVLLAKNHGCYLKDEKFATRLQTWLQGVANGTAIARDGCDMWHELAEHNKSVIDYLITRLNKVEPPFKYATHLSLSNWDFLIAHKQLFSDNVSTVYILNAYEQRRPLRTEEFDGNRYHRQQSMNLLGSYRVSFLEVECFAKS
ncbi:hypothetical protein EK21DRAFT_108615 [Setomelanomma holmii]|uniref:Uncharacterized protein n=1 Tax=Setomelanomma holmii TaxID=210430 RepID=A0A9P4LNH2_9PLEO|nr:hypothetical protein EK21DRAFT_108615 [Setomelanomma holmii]